MSCIVQKEGEKKKIPDFAYFCWVFSGGFKDEKVLTHSRFFFFVPVYCIAQKAKVKSTILCNFKLSVGYAIIISQNKCLRHPVLCLCTKHCIRNYSRIRKSHAIPRLSLPLLSLRSRNTSIPTKTFPNIWELSGNCRGMRPRVGGGSIIPVKSKTAGEVMTTERPCGMIG